MTIERREVHPSHRVPERRRRPEACMAVDPVASGPDPSTTGEMQGSNLRYQRRRAEQSTAMPTATDDDASPGC
jgi:hypothetical protein